MRWRKGSSRNWSLIVPGEIGIKATIVAHSETIVLTIMIGGETVKKWGVPISVGIDQCRKNIEGILNELALGIWEG